MYDLLGRKTGRSDAEMRLWVISQARKRKRYFWTWVNGILLVAFIIFALFLTGCTQAPGTETRGSIKNKIYVESVVLDNTDIKLWKLTDGGRVCYIVDGPMHTAMNCL